MMLLTLQRFFESRPVNSLKCKKYLSFHEILIDFLSANAFIVTITTSEELYQLVTVIMVMTFMNCLCGILTDTIALALSPPVEKYCVRFSLS